MKYIESVEAVCPFYKGHQQQVIYCEGPVDGSAMHLAFAIPAKQEKHRVRYCEKFDYEKCPLAGMLNRKYGV